MSGGIFDYAYNRVNQFADELGVKLDEHDQKDEIDSEYFEIATKRIEDC